MIIMRALVATVLLISVILLSTVLINANTRNVGSGSRIENEPAPVIESVDERVQTKESNAAPVLTRKTPEKAGHRAATSLKAKPVEELDVKSSGDKEGRLISAIQNTDSVQTKPTVAKTTVEFRPKKNNKDIEVNETDIQDELLFTDGFKEKVDVIVHHTTHKLSDSPKVTEEVELEITTISKANQKNNRGSSQTTEQQPSMTPLGYEPENYVVVNAEPDIPLAMEQDDDAMLIDGKFIRQYLTTNCKNRCFQISIQLVWLK